MIRTSSASVSPSKGKTNSTSWSTGWWDFLALTDQTKRPLDWSRSSTIFTAHPSKPQVTARHFSSTKQFVIPSPTPIASAPGLFQPPTVISVSPDDNWLFAFFPGYENDGASCLWRRDVQVDVWKVQEWWTFARGAGVVTAAWAGAAREWYTDANGTSTRLPPRGPSTPFSSPTLLLVTQTHEFMICYIRQYVPSMKVLACSLLRPSSMAENQPRPIEDPPEGVAGIRMCVHASIGLGYNESSILVATRSHLYPPALARPSVFDMDLNFPSDSLQATESTFPEPDTPMEWETWGEESTLDLCEIVFKNDGQLMSVSSNPISSIHQAKSHLTKLAFICTPTTVAEQSSAPSTNRELEGGHIYLAASYLDFGDHAAHPKSELVLHSLLRTPGPSPTNSTWITQANATHAFPSGILAFFQPCGGPIPVGIYVGVVDTFGKLSSKKSAPKEVSIGTVNVLMLPNLTESTDWESSPIMSSTLLAGREIPVNSAISPNHILLCTVSNSPSSFQTSVHQLPKKSAPMLSNSPGNMHVASNAHSLANAVLARRTTSDITHALSLPSTPLDELVETLYQGITLLDKKHNGLPPQATWNAIGLVVEVYRMRARLSVSKADKDIFTRSWQAVHDICSISACNVTFSDCNSGPTSGPVYDKDVNTMWHLVSLSGWVVSFVERLMKQCVLASDSSKPESGEDTTEDLFGSLPSSPAPQTQSPALDSPMLMHLTHPYALINLHTALAHVNRFRIQLGAWNPKVENEQLAKSVLLDLVDCCGIDLEAFNLLLADSMQELKSIIPDEARRSLALCRPVPAMHAPLRKLIHKVTEVSVVDKSRLFIKPLDFVDGAPRSSVPQRKDKDVVLKGPLLKNMRHMSCLRCGGQTKSKDKYVPARWNISTKGWNAKCICGGTWSQDNSALV